MDNKRIFALCASLILLVATLADAQIYRITDLGSLSPISINALGQIAGNLNGQAFIWTGSHGLQDLGTLPGGTSSSAAVINDLGMVAGMADGSDTVIGLDGVTKQYCSDVVQAFVWTRTKGMRGLGTVGVGSDQDSYYWCQIISYASGINLRGQVVGTNDWSSNTYDNGFLWTNAGGVKLIFSAWNNLAFAINNRGDIAGMLVPCCFAYPVSGHASSHGADLGTLGGADPEFEYCSEAIGIDDVGQIVGWSTLSPDIYLTPCEDAVSTHAVLWTQDGSIRDLGTLPGDTSSQAYKINLFGQVIGISGDTFNWVYPPGRPTLVGRPFIWSNRNGIQDLNSLVLFDSGWVLNSVSDINVYGQIVGSGTLNGQSHGFLLTPNNFVSHNE
jgi:uncharacterized membrane protein